MNRVWVLIFIAILSQNLAILLSSKLVPRNCLPQKTPLNGIKWCNFTNNASEIGADCRFSCSEGYALVGPLKNKCILDLEYGPVFKPKQYGSCQRITKPVTGTHGPYYIYTRFDTMLLALGYDKSTFGLTAKNFKYVDEPIKFNVIVPSLKVSGETISLSLYDHPQKYVVLKDHNLKLEDQPGFQTEKNDLKNWEESASFLITADMYFQGYFTLIPAKRLYESLMVNGDHVILGNPEDEEAKKRCSFFISKIQLNSTLDEDEMEYEDYSASGDVDISKND